MCFSLLSCKSTHVEGYRGPRSDHFNGERFTNFDPVAKKSLWNIWKWRLTSNRLPWPKWIPSEPQPVAVPPAGTMRLTFVNHATWLIQTHDTAILTDPVWSDTVGPTSWLGPKRVRAPGVRFRDLPKITAVLISHNHYDHMDVPTLMRLEERDHPLFIVGLGNASFLRQFRITHIHEMDWKETVQVAGIAVHFVPSRHWSRRGWDDINKTLWGGYVMSDGKQSVYFAGDTGYGRHFKQIGAEFPHLSAALLPIGSYEPRWLMQQSHLNPAEAVQAFQDLGAKQGFGMHFGTFQLSDEAIDKPSKDVVNVISQRGLSVDRFIVPEFGQSYDVLQSGA